MVVGFRHKIPTIKGGRRKDRKRIEECGSRIWAQDSNDEGRKEERKKKN